MALLFNRPWVEGRARRGYFKKLLLSANFPLPFDVFLLRFTEGSYIPPHKDPNEDGRHYRINIVLKQPIKGGEFRCNGAWINFPRVKFFRPDLFTHRVDRVQKGTRLVLSIGWLLPKS